jgi:hypothetical protein
MKFSFKRVHTNELHEIEVIVLPIEIVKAARIPFRKIPASIPKNEQAAIRPEVNLHVAPDYPVVHSANRVVDVVARTPYRSHLAGDRLQVDPHAREEIERAKRR